MKVFATPPVLANSPELFIPLRDAGIEVVINAGTYPMLTPAFHAGVADASGIILGMENATEALFRECPNLRIIARWGVGLDNVDLAAATRAGVFVTAPFGINSATVAELTFALMLSLVRSIVTNHNRVQGGVWQRDMGVQLAGKTLGIIGLGRIGRKVALRALAFEMRVIAQDIVQDRAFAEAHGIEYVSREALLETADVITLHVPLTDETRNMIDGAALERMKPGAFLINAARGQLIDTEALAYSLDSGHLAGAALDVFPTEPQIEPFLLHRPNLITTTHIGAFTREIVAATAQASVNSLLQFFQGQTPDHLVNPEAARFVR
jgi:phosphoglycerate dehydrogenase-like enzyme